MKRLYGLFLIAGIVLIGCAQPTAAPTEPPPTATVTTASDAPGDGVAAALAKRPEDRPSAAELANLVAASMATAGLDPASA